MPMSWNAPNLEKKIQETIDLGGEMILMQGGLHPKLKLDWYEDLLRWIKANYRIHIHGFSPPELDWFAKINRMPLRETLSRLRNAGLDSIPGGGAEILTSMPETKLARRNAPLTNGWKSCVKGIWSDLSQARQ